MPTFEILKSKQSSFGRIDVYERFLVATLVSNADRIEGDFYGWVSGIAASEFDRPWGYIANRINNNAGDPSLLAKARKLLPLWSSFAVVSISVPTINLFKLESFSLGDFPHRLCHDLLEAMVWTDGIVQEARLQAGKAK